MRLAIACNSIAGGKGGAERVSVELANEMAKRNHDVYLIFEDRGSPAYEIDKNINLIPYKDISILYDKIESLNIDLFCVFYFNKLNLLRFARIAVKLNIPLAIQECTNPDRLRFNNWRGGKLGKGTPQWEREIITAQAARIRLTMPGYKNSFPNYIKRQVYAFPNPSKKNRYDMDRLNIPKNEYKILNVNGFKNNKNILPLIKAFCILSEKYPKWNLRIIGSIPEWTNQYDLDVKDIIDSYQIWDRIEICGKVDDMDYEYKSSDLHVITSLSEGCPTVVLEAMSSGIPSIGYEDCPGTNELITHEENGFLATSEDRVQGLSDALDKLMSDEQLRHQFGEQAKYDAQHYDPDIIYNKWEKILIESAAYKGNLEKLFCEQYEIDPEKAMHSRRMLSHIL